MSREDVNYSRVGLSFALALYQETVYTRLYAAFVVWEGVEAEVEDGFTVPVANRKGEEISYKAPAVVRVTEALEGSHLDSQTPQPGWLGRASKRLAVGSCTGRRDRAFTRRHRTGRREI